MTCRVPTTSGNGVDYGREKSLPGSVLDWRVMNPDSIDRLRSLILVVAWFVLAIGGILRVAILLS